MSDRQSKGEICWGLLLLMFLGTMILESTIFFLLSCVYFIYVLCRNKFVLVLPKIQGFNTYLLLIIVSFIMGCFLYTFRHVVRDAFYFFSTVIWILIGANLAKWKQFNWFSIYKTLCLFALTIVLYSTTKFLISQEWSFIGIRGVFVIGAYELGVILPMMVLNFIFEHNYAFSKAIDAVIIAFSSLSIFLSLGRISIIVPLLSVILISICMLRYKQEHKRNIGRTLFIVMFLTVIAIVGYFVIPNDVTAFFSEKISVSMQELDNSQIINSTKDAMTNWRAYEIQAAIEQWKTSDILQQIFGSGMGKGIDIRYVPYTWTSMVEDNKIPVLHNGFYTALIKLGLLGSVILLSIFTATFIKGVKGLRTTSYHVHDSIMLVILAVAGVLYMYVVRGMVGGEPFIVWGLLMGMLNAQTPKGEKLQ